MKYAQTKYNNELIQAKIYYLIVIKSLFGFHGIPSIFTTFEMNSPSLFPPYPNLPKSILHNVCRLWEKWTWGDLTLLLCEEKCTAGDLEKSSWIWTWGKWTLIRRELDWRNLFKKWGRNGFKPIYLHNT